MARSLFARYQDPLKTAAGQLTGAFAAPPTTSETHPVFDDNPLSMEDGSMPLRSYPSSPVRSVRLDPPFQPKYNDAGVRQNALMAALGAILGGRGDVAGQFGSSVAQGMRRGEDRANQDALRQWEQQQRNTLLQNQDDRRYLTDDVMLTDRQNMAARQQAGLRLQKETLGYNQDRQKRLDALTAEQRVAAARDHVFATLQKLPTDEARQTYLSSLHLTGRLSALDLDSTFAPTTDGRFTLPDFNKPVDNTAMLGRLVTNPLLTPQGREQVGGMLMSRLGGRAPQGSLTSGMITSVPPAPRQMDPSPAGPLVPAPPATSGPLVPYLRQSAPETATQPPVAPLFYQSGMTPRDEGNIAARRESLRQGAARVAVAQKGLRAREAQVKQQGDIAKTRLAQQGEQFRERIRVQSERDKVKSADKTREEGKKEYQRIDGTIQRLRQELVKLRTATTLRPSKDDLSNDAMRKNFEKRALEADIKRSIRKQELERLIAGYRAQQTDIAKRYGFKLSAAPQTQVGDGWMPNNRIVDFGKGK